MEVFASAVLACRAAPATRVKLLFQLFDLDLNQSLTRDEVVIMLKCVMGGVARLTGGER